MSVFCLKCSTTVDEEVVQETHDDQGEGAPDVPVQLTKEDQDKYQQFLYDVLQIRIPMSGVNHPDVVQLEEGVVQVAPPTPSIFQRKGQPKLTVVVTPMETKVEAILPDGYPNSPQMNSTGEVFQATAELASDAKEGCNGNETSEVVEMEVSVLEKPPSSISEEFPFCRKCVKEIEALYNLHVEMSEITKRFEESRDKMAATMVDTFFQQCECLEQDPASKVKIKSSADVYEKWKHRYTGKEDEESKVKYLLDEKEYQIVERERKLHRMREEKGQATSFTVPRPYGLSAVQLAKIQRAMTVCYFTPKMNVIRKRNRLYFKVGIKPPAVEMKHVCKICSREFPRLDTMNVHKRSHFLGIRKQYKCSFCMRIFGDRKQLLHHTKVHAGDNRRIKCDNCSMTFSSLAAQRTHIKKFHPDIKYECEVCQEKFSSPYFLKKHVATHTEIDFSVTDLFTCKICTKTFLKSMDLNDHLKIHTDDSLVGCEFCGKAFPNNTFLAEHLVIHEGDNPYICEECDSRFSSEALLISHLKNHRPRVHICDVCGKACRSKDGLRKHELTHTGLKPFTCDICEIGFIERKSYEAHMMKHTGKLPYKCNSCVNDEGFKDSKDLRKHKIEAHPELLMHDKSLACEFCWNTYPTNEVLKEHITKIHERYKCHFCNRVFKLGDHLKRHLYIHTGEKPYQCGRCPKSFNQESNLKEHMYRHTGIRPHKCPHCDVKGYLRRIHLKEHMLKEHGTDEIPLLPMGRASQNARKAGQHPVPDPTMTANSIVGVRTPKPQKDMPIIVSTSGSNANSDIMEVTETAAMPLEKKPILFRNVKVSGTVSQKGTPVVVRNIESPVINVRSRPVSVTNSNNVMVKSERNLIQTIDVKSEHSQGIDPMAAQKDQQYIIFL